MVIRILAHISQVSYLHLSLCDLMLHFPMLHLYQGEDADLPHSAHKPVQVQSTHICPGRLPRILLGHFARCLALCTAFNLWVHYCVEIFITFVVFFQLSLQLLLKTPCCSWPTAQLRGWCPGWPRLRRKSLVYLAMALQVHFGTTFLPAPQWEYSQWGGGGKGRMRILKIHLSCGGRGPLIKN